MKHEPLAPRPDAPLLLQPEGLAEASPDALLALIERDRASLLERLRRHGALVLRGFGLARADQFERIAHALDPELRNDYLGTSPRDKKTDYVFSASELPSYYPIAQHCEMSFLPDPPRRLFFFCTTPPAEGGETPIVDFRRVYRDLDPKTRDELERRGIRYIRNYDGPRTKARFDLWKLKRWDEMFLTEDHATVEAKCAKNAIACEWYGDDRLRLINEGDTVRRHPETGEPTWFNHSQVFHVGAAASEYAHVARRQKTARSWGFAGLTRALTLAKKTFVAPEEQALHCTFRDGGAIPQAYVDHVIDTIWKNMVFCPWKKGDVLMIDNFSTSHGRMPYRGPREILVAWTSGLAEQRATS